MYVCMDGQTDGNLRPALLGRVCQRKTKARFGHFLTSYDIWIGKTTVQLVRLSMNNLSHVM